MHKNNILRDNRGTSLIEILVVMVVLLVGIMTIIQMFPTGFRVVRAGESKSVATRLAQQELERWKAMTGNIPEAIVPIDEAGIINNNQAVGPPFEGWTQTGTANGNPVYTRGNELCFRQIIGETTVVPAPSYFGTGGGTWFGSNYTVAFSPIDVSRDDAGVSGCRSRAAICSARYATMSNTSISNPATTPSTITRSTVARATSGRIPQGLRQSSRLLCELFLLDSR